MPPKTGKTEDVFQFQGNGRAGKKYSRIDDPEMGVDIGESAPPKPYTGPLRPLSEYPRFVEDIPKKKTPAALTRVRTESPEPPRPARAPLDDDSEGGVDIGPSTSAKPSTKKKQSAGVPQQAVKYNKFANEDPNWKPPPPQKGGEGLVEGKPVGYIRRQEPLTAKVNPGRVLPSKKVMEDGTYLIAQGEGAFHGHMEKDDVPANLPYQSERKLAELRRGVTSEKKTAEHCPCPKW